MCFVILLILVILIALIYQLWIGVLVIFAAGLILWLIYELFGDSLKNINLKIFMILAVPLIIVLIFYIHRIEYFEVCSLVLCGGLLSAGIAFVIYMKRANEEMEEEALEREEKEREEKEEKENKYKDAVNSLIDKYGEMTCQVIVVEQSFESNVYVFESSKIIVANGNAYHFSDIKGATIEYDKTTTKGEVEYKTKTSTGSMIGRAVVGGVLTGGVGAVIGGATADKKTVAVPKSYDRTVYSYRVIVSTNLLACPTIKIDCHHRREAAKNIASIINIISDRNK